MATRNQAAKNFKRSFTDSHQDLLDEVYMLLDHILSKTKHDLNWLERANRNTDNESLIQAVYEYEEYRLEDRLGYHCTSNQLIEIRNICQQLLELE